MKTEEKLGTPGGYKMSSSFRLHPSSFICAAQHTSSGGFSSIRKRAFDKFALVPYQTGWQ